MQETWDPGLIPAWEDPLEEGMATHSSILAYRIPWTEETGGIQSIGSHRIRNYWSNLAGTLMGQAICSPLVPKNVNGIFQSFGDIEGSCHTLNYGKPLRAKLETWIITVLRGNWQVGVSWLKRFISYIRPICQEKKSFCIFYLIYRNKPSELRKREFFLKKGYFKNKRTM